MNPVLHIPKPPLFDFEECRWFLDRTYNDCLLDVSEGCITKLEVIDHQLVLFRIADSGDSLSVEILNEAAIHPESLSAYIRSWFDMDRDLRPFYDLLGKDADLAPLAHTYSGLRLITIPSLFEALCWCIIGQQIHLRFAHTLKRRLVEELGQAETFGGKTYYLFPEPESLLHISADQWRAWQFSSQKADYLSGIARLFESGSLSKAQLMASGDPQQMFRSLLALRGVGEWTAHYTLMKSLGVMTSVPWGDAGLYNALQRWKGMEKRPPRQQIEDFFAPFAGWESYVVFYLWRSLS
jgi:DNA-3-methyladenine glycosylase II